MLDDGVEPANELRPPDPGGPEDRPLRSLVPGLDVGGLDEPGRVEVLEGPVTSGRCTVHTFPSDPSA